MRKFDEGDEPLLVSYLNDEKLTSLLSARIPQPYISESALWWVNAGSEIGMHYAIICKGVLVGSIGAIPGEFEKQRTAGVGYWVARQYWGRSIASSALERLVDLVFETTNIVRLYASVIEGNSASSKVLSKCGFTLEAVFQKAIYKNSEILNELHFSKLRP